MQSIMYWDMVTWRLVEVYRRFGGTAVSNFSFKCKLSDQISASSLLLAGSLPDLLLYLKTEECVVSKRR
jgi:hypothetical protein